MKKTKIAICLLLILFLTIAIFTGKYCLDKRQSKKVKTHVNIDIPIDNISYIEISMRSHSYIIKNPEKIMEIIQYINDEPLVSMKKKKYGFYGVSESKYKVCIYSEEGVLANVDITDEKLFYKKSYGIVNKGELKEKIKNIVSYCKVCLPEIGYRINGFETSGIEISQEAAIDEYNSMLKAMPIKESEFNTGDTYYFIKTFDDEDIYVYYVGDEKYIKYIKSYTTNVSEDSENISEEFLKEDDVAFFKVSNQVLDK